MPPKIYFQLVYEKVLGYEPTHLVNDTIRFHGYYYCVPYEVRAKAQDTVKQLEYSLTGCVHSEVRV